MDQDDFLKMAFSPKKIGYGGLLMKNVFIKSATFEGMYNNGIPTEQLIDHHVTLAKGDVALTTVSYGAISEDARTFKDQMYINDQSLDKLKILAQKVHEAGGKISMQLTHCGYFTKNSQLKHPLAPSRLFNEYGFMSGIVFSKAMGRKDMEIVSNQFGAAAYRLKGIGFDAVEIHMGHGYLQKLFQIYFRLLLRLHLLLIQKIG